MKSKTIKTIGLLISMVAVAALTGCAGYQLNGKTYGNDSVMQSQSTFPAKVVSIRNVSIVNKSNRTGGLIGGVIGGLGGSAIGHGVGRAVASAVGAVGGAAIGSEAQKRISGRKKGIQVTVRDRQNSLHTVVQPNTGTRFAVGEKVLVVQGRNTRVEPM